VIPRWSSASGWLRAQDAGLAASRRALRAALVMPALFAFSTQMLHLPQLATFAAFGAFATLMFVGYTGTITERVQAQAGLTVVGAGSFASALSPRVQTGSPSSRWRSLGSWCSSSASSVRCSRTPPLRCCSRSSYQSRSPQAPVRYRNDSPAGPSPASSVSSRSRCSGRSPRTTRSGIAATNCTRKLGRHLEAEVAHARGPAEASPADCETAIEAARQAVEALHATLHSLPYRPTGLSTSNRAIVRLVDELGWLSAILDQAGALVHPSRANEEVCAVKQAAARLLTSGADLFADWYDHLAVALAGRGPVPDPLERDVAAVGRLSSATSPPDRRGYRDPNHLERRPSRRRSPAARLPGRAGPAGRCEGPAEPNLAARTTLCIDGVRDY